KTLCQKFHPDRNPGNENANKTFLLIRSAYETLSDPEKRKMHDAWIASMEAAEVPEPPVPHAAASKPEKGSSLHNLTSPLRRKKRIWQACFWIVIALLILVGFFFN